MQAHNSYVNELFENVIMYLFYKYLRSKCTKNMGISSLTSGDIVITEDKGKAQAFSIRFSSVFTKEKTEYIPYRCTHTTSHTVVFTLHPILLYSHYIPYRCTHATSHTVILTTNQHRISRLQKVGYSSSCQTFMIIRPKGQMESLQEYPEKPHIMPNVSV